MQKTILITGSAGFIGYFLSKRMLASGYQVIGVDNINDYYDQQYKYARLAQLQESKNFIFFKTDLTNESALNEIFKQYRPSTVVNLAAQAGIRYSTENPMAYVQSNIVGFTNILEACRHFGTSHLIYASSSSVYGGNDKLPFSVDDRVDHPVSFYAATKRSNELMAYVYSHAYGLATTGLRFFTVYGPFGRPDMSLFLFTKAILSAKPITVYNHGDMKRDFTYIDDIIDGLIPLFDKIPDQKTPYSLYNIGNNNPTPLMSLIKSLENELNLKAILDLQPMLPVDVKETYADIDDLQQLTGFQPKISIEQGVKNFITWYKAYHKIT